MKKWMFTLMLALFSSVLWGQTVVSGKVMAGGVPVAGATVKELDVNHRIVSQSTTDASGLFNMSVVDLNHALSVHSDGYLEHIERLFGRKTVEIALVKGTSLVDEELLMGNHKIEESYKLLYGHNGGRNIPQLVRIEMLNDTLFTLIVPIMSSSQSEAYPAERALIFVDAADNQLLVGKNVMEVYTLIGEPEDVGKYDVMPRAYIGVNYTPNTSVYNSPMFLYPQFLFTTQGLEKLLEQEERIYRLLIDTSRGDNFWILYPSKTFGKEIRKMIAKMTKSKKRKN